MLQHISGNAFSRIAVALLLVGLFTSGAFAYTGEVSGTNTVDYVMAVKPQGQHVSFSVTASGRGSNKLTVKVQQQKSGGGWKTLRTVLVSPGSTVNSSFSVQDQFSSNDELVRYRISRNALTKKISYRLND